MLKITPKITWIFLAMIAFDPISKQGMCQEFLTSDDGRFASIEGVILEDSDRRFRKFLGDNPSLIGVSLNSPGGIVVSAIGMAEEISKHRLSTYIAENQSCASACAILFFAGHDRLVRGRLGVHQMDDFGESNASTLQFVLADQLDAFQRFNIPWSLSRKMLTTPPWQMYWLTDSDIESLGINRDLPGDASGRKNLAYSTASVSEGFTFGEFPASQNLVGDIFLPDFAGRDSEFSRYRTRITHAANQGVNFAGHYSIVEIGCGTSCRFAYVVDLRTGKIISFPYGGEDHYQMTLLYSPDSRLVKARWKDNWDSEECTERDIILDDLEWRVIEERKTPLVNDYCNY